MLDAYTIRKIAPRLLVAAIGVNLSIYFCVAAIDITNVVGHALANLIVQPFADAQGLDFKIDTGGASLAGFLLIGAAMTGIVLTALALSGGATAAIFFTLLPIMLIVLAILIVVVIRQALLVLLTIFSPIAIVCLVLPGTEKYFKQWWDLFLKTLLVYPIIASLFAISNVMAIIAFGSSSSSDLSNGASAAQIIGGLVLSFLPLVMIPFAFKFAGGAIGAAMGSTRGLMHSANRFSGRQRQKALTGGWGKAKAGNFIRTDKQRGFRHNLNKGVMGTTALGRSRMIMGGGGIAGRRSRLANAMANTEGSHADHIRQDSQWYKPLEGDDDKLQVAASGAMTRGEIGAALQRRAYTRFADEHGGRGERERAIDQIMDLRHNEGAEASRMAAYGGLLDTSTPFDNGFKLQGGASDEMWNERHGDEDAKAYGEKERYRRQGEYHSAGAQAADLAASIAHGDVVKEEKLFKMAYGGASAKGRKDIAASASAALMNFRARRTGDDIAQTQLKSEDAIVKRAGAGLYFGHPEAAKGGSIAWQRQVQAALDSGDSGAVTNIMADVAGLQDQISTAPQEAKDHFQKYVSGHEFTVMGANGQTETLTGGQLMTREKQSNPGQWQERRKEYGDTGEDPRNRGGQDTPGGYTPPQGVQ